MEPPSPKSTHSPIYSLTCVYNCLHMYLYACVHMYTHIYSYTYLYSLTHICLYTGVYSHVLLSRLHFFRFNQQYIRYIENKSYLN